MSYTRSSSSSGETIRRIVRESRWYIVSGFVFYTVMFLIFAVGFEGWAVLFYLFWLWYLIARWFTEYAITDRRVVFRRGIVRRIVREIDIKSIEGIDLYQSFWQRLFGIGTVTIRGRGNHVVDFVRVGSAVRFKRILQETVDSRR